MILFFIVGLILLYQAIAQEWGAIKRFLVILKPHGPTLFFGAIFLLATCVLRPTLDKYEEARIAKDDGKTQYAESIRNVRLN